MCAPPRCEATLAGAPGDDRPEPGQTFLEGIHRCTPLTSQRPWATMLLALTGVEDVLLYLWDLPGGYLPATTVDFGLDKRSDAPVSLRRVTVFSSGWLPVEQRAASTAQQQAKYAEVSVYEFTGRPGPPRRTTTRYLLLGSGMEFNHHWGPSATTDVLWQRLANIQSLPTLGPRVGRSLVPA